MYAIQIRNKYTITQPKQTQENESYVKSIDIQGFSKCSK